MKYLIASDLLLVITPSVTCMSLTEVLSLPLNSFLANVFYFINIYIYINLKTIFFCVWSWSTFFFFKQSLKINTDDRGSRFAVKVCTNVLQTNSTYQLQEIQPDQDSSSNQMFSNQSAPYFTMITYLPSTHAVAALLLCQTAPFSLFLLLSYWRAPAPLALCISACPLLSPPQSTKPDPAFTSASQAASTNARFQFPPDVKFQPSPRNPPPASASASGAGKPSCAHIFARNICREAAAQGCPGEQLPLWFLQHKVDLCRPSLTSASILLCLPFLFTLSTISYFFCGFSSVWCDKNNCLCWGKPLPWVKSLPLL